MSGVPSRAAWRTGAVAVSMALAACAAEPPAPEPPPVPPPQASALRVAQLGHGRLATFAWCTSEDCPRRTPKTLAPLPVPAAAPFTESTGPRLPATGVTVLQEAVPQEARDAAPPRQISSHRLSVQFAFASAVLDAAARESVRAIVPLLHRATEVRLSGYTDSAGVAAANEQLAKQRAGAVQRELIALVPDIAPVLSVEARGACCYVEPNDSAAGRARNRRVDILLFVEPDAPP